MKIYVGGSLKTIENKNLCTQFVEKLGALIVKNGHILLNGCRGPLDKLIAESANKYLLENKGNATKKIINYIVRGEEDKKTHQVGETRYSQYKNWSFGKAEPEVPEQINESDVAIFIGGSEGTMMAANFARISIPRKPILGIGTFGGAGLSLFLAEKEHFSENFSYLLEGSSNYENLNVVPTEHTLDSLVVNILDICENLIRSQKVFTIMSFADDFLDVYESFKSICKENGYETYRTDQDLTLSEITPRILNGIKQSDFVIADISELKPNVFYEIGYAKGIRRDVVLTADKKMKKKIPFDVKDFPVIFYDRLNMKKTLEPKLNKIIKEIRSLKN